MFIPMHEQEDFLFERDNDNVYEVKQEPPFFSERLRSKKLIATNATADGAELL